MSSYTRREFGKLMAASVPVAALLGTTGAIKLRAAGTLKLGVSTSSFHDFPRTLGNDNVADIITALKATGTTTIELAAANFEPGPPELGEFVHGGTPAYPSLTKRTPAEIAAVRASVRRNLRAWRFATDMSYFKDVRTMFDNAGIRVHAVAFDYTDNFTDDEIDLTLKQAEAMGVSVVSSPLTMDLAARLAPIAAKHQVRIAIHNQVDDAAGSAVGVAALDKALALSPAFALKLDIGNLTAANCDAVAELDSHRDRLSHVLVQDRLRNGGASQAFGDGDTPIATVLSKMRASAPNVPAIAEYSYFGLNSPVIEVKHCLSFMQQAS